MKIENLELAKLIAEEITIHQKVLNKLTSYPVVVGVSVTWLDDPFIKEWTKSDVIYKKTLTDFIAGLIIDTSAQIEKLTKELDAL